MSERELIDYIQLLLLQGQSVDRIKQDLLSEYPMEVIDGALKKIKITSTDFSPTLNQSSAIEPTLSHTLWGNPVNVDTKKSSIIVLISFLHYSIAVLYLLLTIASIGLSFVLDRISFTNELVLPWLRYFPAFGLLPIIFAITTIYFFFEATKILDGSRKSFYLAMVSLFAFPPLLATLHQQFTSALLSTIINSVPNTSVAQISYSMQKIGVHIFDPILLLSIISVLLLLLTFNKYHHATAGFSVKGRIMLALLFLFIFLPTASLSFWFYVRAADTDYGYKSIQGQVDFHVYRPDDKTSLIPTSKYAIEPDGEKANAVHINFDTPLPMINSTTHSKPISISQERVESGFDLVALSKTYNNNADVLRQIPVLTAGNKAGYYFSSQTQRTKLNYLLFVTPDNVLIILSSPNASEADLVKFAESLI